MLVAAPAAGAQSARARGGLETAAAREARLLPEAEKAASPMTCSRTTATSTPRPSVAAYLDAPGALMRRALAACSSRSPRPASARYVHRSEPAWYPRIRYPLRYKAIIREHARNYDLAGARRRGHLHGVEVRPEHALADGRDRPDAAPPATAKGIATARAAGASRQRPLRPGDQRPLRLLVPPQPARATGRGRTPTTSPSPPTTPARRTSTAGSRRRRRARRSRSASRRRARTSTACTTSRASTPRRTASPSGAAEAPEVARAGSAGRRAVDLELGHVHEHAAGEAARRAAAATGAGTCGPSVQKRT